MHKHRCVSCGHVWEHDESCRGNRDLHICQRCGDGPWFWRYDGDEPVSQLVMDEFCDFVRLASWARVAFGIAVVLLAVAWFLAFR
jgi:hypothetical protein